MSSFIVSTETKELIIIIDEHMGSMIGKLRKEKGMTQQELADQLHVTDKVVSKWERNLSYPDLTFLPKLAEIFGVSADDLISSTTIQQLLGFSSFKTKQSHILNNSKLLFFQASE